MSAVRLGGGITAVVLVLLLSWLAIVSFGPGNVVRPSVSIDPLAASAKSGAGKEGVTETLADRTRLLGDRTKSGEISGIAVSSAINAERDKFKSTDGVKNPAELVKTWQNEGDSAKILRTPGFTSGLSSLPYTNAALLEQPEGRDWRRSRDGFIRYGGGWLILGVSLALALFLLARGRIRIKEGQSGEKIERFPAFERANHWMTATGFILLALTGLIITYGRPFLLPVFGASAFGAIATSSAWIHVAAGVPFVIGVVGMIFLWARQNIPTRLDVEWLKQGGGFLHEGENEPPSQRFNAGQKIVFWGVVLGGILATATGLALIYPFLWLGIAGMQWAQLIHATIGMLMIALIIGHIYIGTVGMEGAVDAMWTGKVDANWAKTHHKLWYERLKKPEARSKRQASQAPGPGRPSPAE